MKIAVIIWSLNVKGGTQRQALNLVKKLADLGHDVTIYAVFYYPEDCYKDLLSGQKVKFLFKARAKEEEKFLFGKFLIKSSKVLKYPCKEFKIKGISREMEKLIADDTEILNPHDHQAFKIAFYIKKNRNIPSVWMANDIPSGRWLDYKLYIKSGVKKIIYFLIDKYERGFMEAQDDVVVLDRLNKELFREYYNLKCSVIRSGLDIDKFSLQTKNKSSKGKECNTKILMVGIFAPYRRFEDGVIAVKLLQEERYSISLEIVGGDMFDKEYKKKVEGIVDEYNLKKIVKFSGEVSEEKLVNLYWESDVFVFPCHLQTWGLAVFEAMACGTPVIVSKTAGASEVIEDLQTGLIVEPKTPFAIKEAVKKLIDNPDLYTKISKNSVKFVRENISWEKYAKEMVEVFKRAKKK